MSLPDDTQRVIDTLLDAARSAFGDALRSVVLYGSAAEGRLRATSDVNLLFVLSRFDASADAFREPFRFAAAAANVTAMFVLERELPYAAEEFAQKFADIVRRHVVLHGEDLLSGLSIPRDALVRRLQQVLLNLTIRLREMYIERSLREEQCAVTVAEAAGPLRTSAASILELEGRGVLPPKEALEALVAILGRAEFAELLPHLSEARERRALPAGSAARDLLLTLDLAGAMHERALRLSP
jgi:predicted nucleotidyltransferase